MNILPGFANVSGFTVLDGENVLCIDWDDPSERDQSSHLSENLFGLTVTFGDPQ